jgi:RNA polymerase sigma-70 factor (sigma-E family)
MDDEAEDQFRAFVNSRWAPLKRFAFALTGDVGHAEDLLQTALLSCHRRWPHITNYESPELYVRRAVINLNISWWRRRRVTEFPTLELPEVQAPDAIARFDTRDEIWTAILALPARMRAVLVLRYLEDFPERDVAQILGCSVGSVKSQASRGLARLRSVLEPVDDKWAEAESTQ